MRAFLASFLILPTVAQAAAPATAGAADRAIKDIATLESGFEAGLAARDVKLLEPLLADRFVWIHASDGRVDGRKEWLANAARGMALSGQRNARTEHDPTVTLYGEEPHTAVRISRVRLVQAEVGRESWLRQTHTLVRNAAGAWQIAMGQGVVMYEGPPLDAALHARYAGVYAIDDGRKLLLEWSDGQLLATFPNGAKTQVFLLSPTEEAVRNLSVGSLHFTLDDKGNPTAASLMRGSQEVWRGTREGLSSKTKQ
jgi:ketosteroid isomerase-like protein